MVREENLSVGGEARKQIPILNSKKVWKSLRWSLSAEEKKGEGELRAHSSRDRIRRGMGSEARRIGGRKLHERSPGRC